MNSGSATTKRLDNCIRLTEYTFAGMALLLLVVGVGWFGHELEVDTGFWCSGSGDRIELCVINYGGNFGFAALNLCSFGFGLVNVGGWAKGGLLNLACFYGAGFRNFACAFASGETEPSLDTLSEQMGLDIPAPLASASLTVGGVLPEVLLVLLYQVRAGGAHRK